jgi:hypothetical protein
MRVFDGLVAILTKSLVGVRGLIEGAPEQGNVAQLHQYAEFCAFNIELPSYGV